VTFYGSSLTSSRWPGVLSGVEAARTLKAPWLGIYGERDASTPAGDLSLLREALERNSVSSTMIVYPNVGHGFALDLQGRRHASAEAEGALEQLRLFLGANLR